MKESESEMELSTVFIIVGALRFIVGGYREYYNIVRVPFDYLLVVQLGFLKVVLPFSYSRQDS